MPHNANSSPSTSLPGPVTAPGSNLPNASSPIALQPLSPSATGTSTTTPIQKQFLSPWKYEGYKAFSAWMASEDDFFVFRRFQCLNARTILWMQDRIVQLENELQKIDIMVENSSPDMRFRNDSFRWDEKHMQKRHGLMQELSLLLHHYNQYIESYSKVRARPRSDKRQISNVANWLTRGAVRAEERAFIEHKGDLISINHRTRPPLGRWLESFPKLHYTRLFRAKPRADVHHTSAYTLYSSDSVFESFTNISIIVVGLVMLLAPMWWLEHVSDRRHRLMIITGFVCIFIFMMALATVNRPFEVVAATAAYAAVLMVFMQIDGYHK